MTTTQRDGVLTIANGRLRFMPEVYPVEHLRNEGWHKESDGSWTAPYTPEHAQRVLALFPDIACDNTAPDLLWLVRQQAPPDPKSPWYGAYVPPYTQLYGYQQRAAIWLARRRSAILCEAPGLGKTPITLTALQMATPRQPRVLIVCPLTLLLNWRDEARRWWPQTKVVLQEPEIFSTTDLAPLLSIVTYDVFRQSVFDRVRQGTKDDGTPKWVYVPRKQTLREWKGRVDALIFDESVLLKNRHAIRSRAAAVARKVIPVCWMLSGAPTTRFYDDLWSQLHILEPKTYSSYWRWSPKYVLISETIWGRQIVANVPGIEPTLKRDLAPILYSYSYADLAREEPQRAIPEWVFETRQVPLPAQWWRLYKQMQDRFVADLPDGNRVLAPNTLARLVRLLQLASHPALLANAETGNAPDGESAPQDFSGYDWSTKGGKVSAIPELLDELPGPTILWTTFIATAKHLAATLKAPCLIGETPAEERTKIVAAFQAGKHPVLIAHPGVGRFGLTLTAGKSSVYVERSYDGDAFVQSLYRIRRIGTTDPPRVVLLEATGPNGEKTVDALCGRVLDYRLQKATAITASLVKEVLG